MNIKPIKDRIVVRLVELEQRTASGLVIPDTAQEKPTQGEVVAVGTGRVDERGVLQPLSVKIGDRILFTKHAGQTLKVNQEDVHILREDEIIAVIE